MRSLRFAFRCRSPRKGFLPHSCGVFRRWHAHHNFGTSVGRGTGAFIYLPPFSENSPIFRSFPFAKIQPVFLPEQTGRMKHRTPFSTPATPAGITHYTLLRKVVCQMGALPPLETPTRKGGTLPPSTGRIPPFLVIQLSGCIG